MLKHKRKENLNHKHKYGIKQRKVNYKGLNSNCNRLGSGRVEKEIAQNKKFKGCLGHYNYNGNCDLVVMLSAFLCKNKKLGKSPSMDIKVIKAITTKS